MYELLRYQGKDGREPLTVWLHRLRDRQAYAHVLARLDRLENGNFGQCRSLQSGVWELKIDHGPGYRVYYGQAGKTVLLLLCGGDKRSQRADIERAVEYWKEFRSRQK
jgi:putative addiction module killer protein